MGFYEALWSISVFFLFLLLDRTPRRPGFYVCLLGALYVVLHGLMSYKSSLPLTWRNTVAALATALTVLARVPVSSIQRRTSPSRSSASRIS